MWTFPFSLQFWKGPERHLLRTSNHGSSADLQWTGGGGVGVCKPCDSSHQILGLTEPGEGTAVYTLLWNVLLGLSMGMECGAGAIGLGTVSL